MTALYFLSAVIVALGVGIAVYEHLTTDWEALDRQDGLSQ